ncbi:choline kinase family protein [Methylocystis sp. SC2]|uniref:choline kinase family protein n=1 Tax=Methylocystis sp. (strain SC2) TaxID=187303 RepID=UPI00027AEE89|nr:choline kinase family protein [Methylocystis sp. SC2]CCJ08188.1 Choline/ethanolamine kinase [Methylocystis sp. SC2]
MSAPTADPETFIRALPLWRGPIDIAPLLGGITNKNYIVIDGGRRVVVRLGGDIPVHGVMRFNELAASRAAGAAGVSPKVLYSAPMALALEFISGRTYNAEDVCQNRKRCVDLIKRVHHEVARHLRGPTLAFNVFHIIRDYAHTLVEDKSRISGELPRLLAAGEALEKATGPIDLVFGHNDLLAANFIDDGRRLWLVDWDYAGWNTPLFDLGGLSSNNGFNVADDEAMLEEYFEAPATDALRRRFKAMLCASLLRETLWSLVSESRSTIDFDYVGYSDQNMSRFEAAWAAFQQMEIA